MLEQTRILTVGTLAPRLLRCGSSTIFLHQSRSTVPGRPLCPFSISFDCLSYFFVPVVSFLRFSHPGLYIYNLISMVGSWGCCGSYSAFSLTTFMVLHPALDCWGNQCRQLLRCPHQFSPFCVWPSGEGFHGFPRKCRVCFHWFGRPHFMNQDVNIVFSSLLRVTLFIIESEPRTGLG